MVFRLKAILTFKIKRYPLPGVGNRGDSIPKSTNGGGDVDKNYFLMSDYPVSAHRGP